MSTFDKVVAWLLGLDNATSIKDISNPSLSASWANNEPFWVILGVTALLTVALLFYLRLQDRGGTATRWMLGISRGLVLVLVFLTLAEPVIRTTYTRTHRPYLYFIFDGTDSMAIEDRLPEEDRKRISLATGTSPTETRSRMGYLQSFVGKEEENLLVELQKKLNVEAFVFDGTTTAQVRKLELNPDGDPEIRPQHVAKQLSTDGQVTAMGAVFNHVNQQLGTGRLAGVVVFSDFANNSGVPPLGTSGSGQLAPASRLGVPVYTVGIGATESMDLAVDVQTDPKMKKAERTTVMVKLRQTGMKSEQVTVRVTARRLGGLADGLNEQIRVGEKTVTLNAATEPVEFSFTPKDSGRFEFIAEVDPVDGEIVKENNRAVREVNIIDDYLRLMYVAYEPTWEWRFIKEVFHRDKLVGMQGFRTYLSSSDARVRENNVLFLPTLAPKRSDFFANDVIFLGDMPRQGSGGQASGFSDRFCEMVKEYVGQFGGGLVVIAGPRFGLKEMAGTPLADMLPVIIDPEATIRDDDEFALRLTPFASNYPFMNLGENDVENRKAWENLNRLQWYYPVAQTHALAEVLAEHPVHTCRDGKTPQPLIAIRRYGKGEVVYVAMNEMWRLRRKYGEKHYRQFWSQLIYRLGMSHALGSEKRFVVRPDRQHYRVEDTVTLSVEAYDENFEPLTEQALGRQTLEGELIIEGADGQSKQIRTISVPLLRDGVFEARIPAYSEGEYRLRVKDPVSGEFREVRFDVANVSAERRSAVRNKALQESLARETKGQSYDLTNVSRLIDDVQATTIVEPILKTHKLAFTPLWFILLVGLLLSEWLVRELINLT
jgi:hypothetical protein